MNTNILRKCIDELNKDNFRKDYVLGMLESLYETQEKVLEKPVFTVSSTPPVYVQPSAPSVYVKNNDNLDEEAMLNAQAIAMMKKVDLTAIQTE